MSHATAERRDLPASQAAWLDEQAEALDDGSADADFLAWLAQTGLTGVGVPEVLGGAGGTHADTVETIAALAQHSLTAAFVFWGHRCYTEYVILSDNPALRERELPGLLDGRWAGATGMSNAMKFLGGIEPLQIVASPASDGPQAQPRWRIDGQLPWVTHLRPGAFRVAAAVQPAVTTPVPVFTFHAGQTGLQRSDDLPLIALRGSQTAAVRLEAVLAGPEHRLHADLAAWLPDIRPPFLGFQCGMSIGLARASLAAARERVGSRDVLAPRLTALAQALAADTGALLAGLEQGRFRDDAAALFRLRIALAQHVQAAAQLELQASGGRAYLQGQSPGFARRWREAAFIPVITPSLTQLEAQLRQYAPA